MRDIMEEYKIRQAIEYGDDRRTELTVFEGLHLYEMIMEDSEIKFRIDKGIIELGVYFCRDDKTGSTIEACLLGRWRRP
jgi:hypothetical protein